MATAEMKLTFDFEDETKQDLRIGPFDPASNTIKNAKANIKAFSPVNVKNVLISEGGASCTALSGATIYEVNEREINLND